MIAHHWFFFFVIVVLITRTCFQGMHSTYLKANILFDRSSIKYISHDTVGHIFKKQKNKNSLAVGQTTFVGFIYTVRVVASKLVCRLKKSRQATCHEKWLGLFLFWFIVVESRVNNWCKVRSGIEDEEGSVLKKRKKRKRLSILLLNGSSLGRGTLGSPLELTLSMASIKVHICNALVNCLPMFSDPIYHCS